MCQIVPCLCMYLCVCFCMCMCVRVCFCVHIHVVVPFMCMGFMCVHIFLCICVFVPCMCMYVLFVWLFCFFSCKGQRISEVMIIYTIKTFCNIGWTEDKGFKFNHGGNLGKLYLIKNKGHGHVKRERKTQWGCCGTQYPTHAAQRPGVLRLSTGPLTQSWESRSTALINGTSKQNYSFNWTHQATMHNHRAFFHQLTGQGDSEPVRFSEAQLHYIQKEQQVNEVRKKGVRARACMWRWEGCSESSFCRRK